MNNCWKWNHNLNISLCDTQMQNAAIYIMSTRIEASCFIYQSVYYRDTGCLKNISNPTGESFFHLFSSTVSMMLILW